jgi:predicted MFS family arabinose efflux permease
MLSSHTVGMAIGAYGGGLTYTLTGSYFLIVLAQGVLEMAAAGMVFAIRKRSSVIC